MYPTTVDRVPNHTSDEVNARIRRDAEQRITNIQRDGSRGIAQRLDELDREWDIERTLEANAATVALLGLGLGAFLNKRFFALPAVVAAFLLQHAVQGWCPPVPIFRRLGFRTQPEIERERHALKALRGDFRGIGPDSPEAGAKALAAAER